jgi:ribosome maturation factor RimP
MRDAVLEAAVKDEIGSIIDGMGFTMVELEVKLSHKNTHVSLVVYRDDGVGIDDLADLNRVLKPKLERLKELGDFTLTVSSPGIDRRIKHRREYSIFKGKGIRVLLEDETDWLGGIIEDSDESYLNLKTLTGVRKIDLEDIRKAKLDYEEEVQRIKNVL